MRIAILAGKTTDITQLVTAVTWSGSRTQAARKLEFSIVQDTRDKNIPEVNVDVGYTVEGRDDSNKLVFKGNIYDLERDRAKSTVKIVSYDNLYVLNKSKTTRKFEKITPESITRQICAELGVYVGSLAKTNTPVSFIANSKTGYQIILGAYTEAAKKTSKKYQCIMTGDRLDVIEKGELCGVVLDSEINMSDSVYKENIEELINSVVIADAQGNISTVIQDKDSIRRYSMYQDVYKSDPQKDAQTEARAMFKKPERSGNITALGDYRVISGYSLMVKDALFKGQFWIKSDNHTFNHGIHQMKVELEFENVATEEKVESGSEK